MSKIYQVVTDVDGCLTDGGVYYFNNDQLIARKFSTFDGEGFKRLRDHGITCMLVSSSDDYAISKRARWLGVATALGVRDKAAWMKDYFNHDALDEAAFFGNDLPDLGAMKLCSFVGCPADAHSVILDYVENYAPDGYVCSRVGGDGAFREFADFILMQ